MSAKTQKKTTKSKVAVQPKPRKRRITLSLRAAPGCKVAVAGDFNDWSTTAKPMVDKRGDGLYAATLCLAPGTYEYKFVVDGIWCVDQENEEWVQSSLGSLNSVLRIE